MAPSPILSREADEALVARLLRDLGLPETLASLLLAHAEAVARESPRLNLVSERDLSIVVRRHTADSLLFAQVRAPAPGESWADVGSGAGFPGLVLACCYPATSFALIEPARRRAAFLEIVSAQLGLANAEVVVQRAERVTQRFDVCVARALASPDVAAARLLGLLSPGGEALLAVSAQAAVPAGATLHQITESVVDSPGRFLRMARP